MKAEISRPEASRRELLKKGGATLAALALGNPLSTALAADAKDPYGGFRMGVQSYSFRGFPFPEAVKKTKALGLKYIELFPGHFGHSGPMASKFDEYSKILKDEGMTADAYGVVPFSKDEAAARAIFEFAKKLGLISISAGPDPDSFDLLDKLVEEYKIPIAIHNHGPHDRWGDPKKIHAAIKDHHPMVGICCDCGHFLRSGVDPVDAIKLLKGRVFGFHIKDFVSEETEVSAGDGKLNLVPLLTEARAQKFDGACSLEYELDPKDPVAGMEKGLANFRKAVAALA